MHRPTPDLNTGSPALPPRNARYLEDYRPGARYHYGAVRLEATDIVRFAEAFDPQPIHIDAGAAARGPFGGLIASGWHTAAAAMRLYVLHFLTEVASLASPGVDELRWLEPVRPGDDLSITVEILEARASRSKPGQGVLRNQLSVLNQHGRVVMTVIVISLVGSRPAGLP